MPAKDVSYLDGQLLVAMPGMKDRRFQKSVIYLCAHSAQGAMGLIINQIADHISFAEFLSQFNMLDNLKQEGTLVLPERLRHMDVHIGGPVETGRGFVLHSSDYYLENNTLVINDDISLSSAVDILRAIVEDRGPARSLLALGYAGWAPGQLEAEIQANGWLVCPADEALVFDVDPEHKYAQTFARLQIDPAFLMSEAGHA